MINNIFFSILIPAYKSKFLHNAISSVLNQTYNKFEIIIVDDCSPENLWNTVKLFHDDRIRFFRNEEGFGAVNVVGNWNKCLNYANGDYVICMGDDDELAEGCLEKYVKLISDNPGFNVYHTRMAIINENSVVYDIQEERPLVESVYSAIWHTWRKERRHVLGDWLFKVKELKEIGGFVNFPCAWGSDGITAFKLAANNGIVNSSYVGFKYRMSILTISSDDSSVYSREKVKAWVKIESFYKSFLKKTPNNEIDKIYWNYLSKNLHARMKHNKRQEIKKSLSNNVFNTFWWLKHSKEFDMTKKEILALSLFTLLISVYNND